MPFGHLEDLEKKPVANPLADQAFIRVLIGPDQGWQDHVMRVFDIEANGYTPKHEHDWPQINFILEGEGTLLVDGKLQDLKPGHYAYVPANTLHQFKASSNTSLKFICIVPLRGHQ